MGGSGKAYLRLPKSGAAVEVVTCTCHGYVWSPDLATGTLRLITMEPFGTW